jgi:flagellar motor switch protein FliN/FliY
MNDNNILSQEEIDALMKKANTNGSSEELNEEEIDVLGEIGNIAMGSAATALYTILDQKVEITTPEVKVSKFSEVSKEYTRPCVLVKVQYTEGLEGVNLLIINEEDASIIADLMMGGDGSNKDEQLDEIRISAVGEAMNQMMGSASTALASIIDNSINISPPEPSYLDLGEALDSDEYFDGDELVVSTSFQLRIGNLVDSSFKQLAPIDFTKKLVAKLLDADSGGLTVKDEYIPEENIDDNSAPEVEDRVARQEKLVQKEVATTYSVNKDPVGVKRAQFPDFDTSATASIPQNMELIHDVPLQVTVRLGQSKMTIKEILDLGEGSIVELDKLAGEPVDLLVNGKLIAKGEVVVIDENFGFRVKDIISPMERINNI